MKRFFTTETKTIITKQELEKLIQVQNKKLYLIDLRKDEEIACQLPNSRHIPIDDLDYALRLDPVQFNKEFGFSKFTDDQKVVFYCRSGQRGSRALFIAKQLGLNEDNFFNLQGGMCAWNDLTRIQKCELEKLITDKTAVYTLIDVREDYECKAGMIDTAIQIKLDDFLDAFKMNSESFKQKYGVDKPGVDDHVIVYCRSGKRSAVAQYISKKLGYKNCRNYVGSALEWFGEEHDKKI